MKGWPGWVDPSMMTKKKIYDYEEEQRLMKTNNTCVWRVFTVLCVVDEMKDTSCSGAPVSVVGVDRGTAGAGRLSSALSSLCTGWAINNPVKCYISRTVAIFSPNLDCIYRRIQPHIRQIWSKYSVCIQCDECLNGSLFTCSLKNMHSKVQTVIIFKLSQT